MKESAQVVLINSEGLVLAVSRKDNHSDFGLPGGKVDPGETPEQAAIRETKEETGLDIYDLQLVFSMFRNGYMGYTYLAKHKGDIKHDEPHIVKWSLFDVVKNGSFAKFNTLVSESLFGMGIKFNEDKEISGTISLYETAEVIFGSIKSFNSLFCPYCKVEQAEHPENIIRNENKNSYECDDCGKEFFCDKTEDVTYWSFK